MQVDDTVEMGIRGRANEAGDQHYPKPDAQGRASGDVVKRVEQPCFQVIPGFAFRVLHADLPAKDTTPCRLLSY